MNILNRIRSIYFLQQVLKGKREIYQWHTWHQAAFRLYRENKFFECERNLAAAVLRQERKKNPYQIQGWDEAKKEYEDYFKMDGAIKDLKELKEGDYVTLYRKYFYFKDDKRLCYKESFPGWDWGYKPIVFKIIEWRDKMQYFKLDGNYNISLTEDVQTAFRYSTPEEIESYEAEKRRQKELDKEIKIKQEELSNLYKQKA